MVGRARVIRLGYKPSKSQRIGRNFVRPLKQQQKIDLERTFHDGVVEGYRTEKGVRVVRKTIEQNGHENKTRIKIIFKIIEQLPISIERKNAIHTRFLRINEIPKAMDEIRYSAANQMPLAQSDYLRLANLLSSAYGELPKHIKKEIGKQEIENYFETISDLKEVASLPDFYGIVLLKSEATRNINLVLIKLRDEIIRANAGEKGLRLFYNMVEKLFGKN